jgi:hypothetical protein
MCKEAAERFVNCVVIIPLYKSSLTQNELSAIHQCKKVLSNHEIVFVGPSGLNVGLASKEIGCISYVSFDKEYFLSPDTYSRLLLSHVFYQRFCDFEYLLIYQLDAFVFKDDLRLWCDKGYDYVGAPWLARAWPQNFMTHVRKRLRVHRIENFWYWNLIPKRRFTRRRDNAVGNGGFSLRNVSSSLAALDDLRAYADEWRWNEDTFWGIFAPNMLRRFRVPPASIAARFSLELEPRDGYRMNGAQLPFGCHAWWSIDPDFWRPHFKSHGLDIQ